MTNTSEEQEGRSSSHSRPPLVCILLPGVLEAKTTRGGGIEERHYTVGQALSEKYNVVLISPFHGKYLRTSIISDRFAIMRVFFPALKDYPPSAFGKLLSFASLPVYSFLALVRVVSFTKDFKVLLVVTDSASGLLPILASKLLGFRIVYSEGNEWPWTSPYLFKRQLSVPQAIMFAVKLLLGRIAGQLSSAVRVQDEGILSGMIRVGIKPDKVVVIGGGADSGIFKPSAGGRASDDKSFLSVGFVGRLTDEKGTPLLLGICRKALVEAPNLKFVIMGDGPYRPSFESLRNIEHVGHVERGTLPSFINRVDLVLSLQPNLGLGEFESLACGKPLIVAANTPSASTVSSLQIGVVAGSDLDSFIRELNSLSADRQQLLGLSANARLAVLTSFSWDIVNARWRDLVDSVFSHFDSDQDFKISSNFLQDRTGEVLLVVVGGELTPFRCVHLTKLTKVLCSMFREIVVIHEDEWLERPSIENVTDISIGHGMSRSDASHARRLYRFLSAERRKASLLLRFSNHDAILFVGIFQPLSIGLAKIRGNYSVLFGGGFDLTGVQGVRARLRRVTLLLKWVMQVSTIRLLDVTVVESPAVVDSYKLRRFRKKVYEHGILYVDTDRFIAFRSPKSRKYDFAFIGALSYEKGILELLDALPGLYKERAPRGLILGDGMLFRRVKESLTKEHLQGIIDLRHSVPYSQIPAELNDIRLLIVPSRTEGLPNIVLEAMACGTVVLATQAGGIEDVVRDGSTGFVLNGTSPQVIARKMTSVLDKFNSGDLELVRRNAMKEVRERYSLQASSREWAVIFSKSRSHHWDDSFKSSGGL